MNSYLENIIARKMKEVEKLKAKTSFREVLAKPGLSVIAEIKRKSPSKGHIADIIDPIALASIYKKAGANAISVLTDGEGFGGVSGGGVWGDDNPAAFDCVRGAAPS